MSTQKFDAYQMVTDRIISLMESGVIPWARPWSGVRSASGAWSRRDGRAYSMLNQMLLADPEKKYTTWEDLQADIRGEWLTFKQAIDLGGNVRKGEKGRKVVFFKISERVTDELDEDGKNIVKKYPILKTYTVFRVDQCEGITQKWYTGEGEAPADIAEDLTAETVIADYLRRSGVTMLHVEGDRAYYSPMLDRVVLPLRSQFHSTGEYYSTAMHELAHSTGHESRLNRLENVAAFGDESYSTEELTAEICSASILATLGIDTAGTLRNSAAYVQSWLKALKNDKKMIVVASARAEKALQMLLDVKPVGNTGEEKSEDREGAAPAENTSETTSAAPVIAQAANTSASVNLYSAPECLLTQLKIKHPNGVMYFEDVRSFFPMTQKDFKIVLPLLRYVASDTLSKFRYTLGVLKREEELTTGRKTYLKRIADNIAALEKMYPELSKGVTA